MGDVSVITQVKDGQVQAQVNWSKATPADLSLAVTQLEIAQKRLLAEIEKLGISTETKDKV